MKNCVVCLLPFACILALRASNTTAGKPGGTGAPPVQVIPNFRRKIKQRDLLKTALFLEISEN